jgi:hypothetical protein
MSKRIGILFLFLLAAMPGFAQNLSPTRDQTRELVRATLNKYGPATDVNISFKQSDANPYNFSGSMTTGLKNMDSLEVVVKVSEQSTIDVMIYPHYKGAYINLDKVKDPNGFMRMLLGYNYSNFFRWGTDPTNDMFASFKFTLESGYPDEAMYVILSSIKNLDQFLGQLRPSIDGTAAQ